MNIEALSIGKDIPNDFNVVIEIPANTPGIKYELDKDSGCVLVDRFMATPMHYPCDYGFIPHTLSEDGDPVDVLVVAPYPLQPGVVVRCRPLGMLEMEDESGIDAKLIAVPVSKLTPIYDKVQSTDDLPPLLLQQIAHFFEHYKDLEKGKWVKVKGWKGLDAAKQEILDSVKRFESSKEKPKF
ncbi:inorganic diphosphatase [Azovibrio restrictus]|uniref:inorganic diphosphatase n=1 Tax=Azovibrio restrictus TaxID=146938 RepID=UPI0026E9D477|nr:inorganic diphosphatase [Azovibrio restrictus]